ncbi:MAG TPA: S-layer homology domain-containing protein, partial [Thermosynergistes sp.]|nr:S-layer homology domain-containing protein [Thermosynergistes sp.]
MKKFFALLAVAVLVAFAAPAFAANPFVDVPMNHWSYDALSQLAAKGIIQGYPDGSFKGNQPMTRYEMATAVARALATVDMDKASKEDVEMLKRLVVEFKDELDALGVKVDELDERVAVLEKNLGGWRFYGELRFTAEWADEEGQYSKVGGDTEFDLDRYRLWMTRKIDDKTTMIMRLGAKDKVEDTVGWERYYAE